MKKMKYRYDKKTKAIVNTPDCTEEYLDLIWNVLYDHDESKENETKELVKEIKGYIVKAKACLKGNKVNINEELNFLRRNNAEQEKYIDLNKIKEDEEIKENKENVHVA